EPAPRNGSCDLPPSRRAHRRTHRALCVLSSHNPPNAGLGSLRRCSCPVPVDACTPKRILHKGAALADDEKIGTVWTDDELDLVVADYFAMLAAEQAGRAYVKSHHAAALMAKIGRTHRSVEFKHMNISAVLAEIGQPTIP